MNLHMQIDQLSHTRTLAHTKKMELASHIHIFTLLLGSPLLYKRQQQHMFH